MLRITIFEKDGSTRFRLEGKLTGLWVKELERCWILAKHVGHGRRLIVDLDSVSFVDDKGKALLESMVEEHAELEATDPLMASVAATIVEHSSAAHAHR